MATKITKKVTQKPILNSDVNAPDIVEEKTTPISKSRKKTSLEEFALLKNLRPEIKAGFRVWLKGQYFYFDEEWEVMFDNYMNRKLK